MSRHAFYDKGLERVWSGVFEDNIGSLKMAEKCGLKVEGLMREDFEEVLADYEDIV